MTDAREPSERRILILAPTGKDAMLTRAVLRNLDLDSFVCTDAVALEAAAETGAGCVLVAEEAIAGRTGELLAAFVDRQPPWSDIPVLVLTHQGADSPTVTGAASRLGNVTLLERPVRVSALVSAIRAALRARERQYQIRQHLLERMRSEQALLEADRYKNEFLATLSHELRNPLAAIYSSLHLLRMSGRTDATVTSVREMMERQVSYIVRLVDDLLEILRLNRGSISLRKERVAIAAVVQSAVESTQPFMNAERHQLTIDVPPEPLLVDADPMRLSQVIANLLSNAAKYSGGKGRIELRVRRDGADVVVAVRDDGIGIPPEKLSRVFDMFVQVDNGLHLTQGGLGIGLTLARSLVELHGGTIEARSEGLGHGSEFIVRLPCTAADGHAEQVSPPATSTTNLSHLSVLVVDDNKDAADSLGLLLRALGAQVDVAHDGPAALTRLESQVPDVVFLDIGMPGMDGYEVARRIRADSKLAGLVLVALSGWGQEEDRRRSRMVGIDHHLIKPADIDSLVKLLDELQARSMKSRETVVDLPRNEVFAAGSPHDGDPPRPHLLPQPRS